MPHLGQKCVWFGPKWDKPRDFFRSDLSTFWLSDIWSEKALDLSYFGPTCLLMAQTWSLAWLNIPISCADWCSCWPGSAGRSQHQRLEHQMAAEEHRPGESGACVVRHHHCWKHPLRTGECHPWGNSASHEKRECLWFHHGSTSGNATFCSMIIVETSEWKFASF